MEGLIQLTDFMTKETLTTMGLSLVLGAGLILIVVQANKKMVDNLFKKLAKTPIINKVISKPIKTETLTNLLCYVYTCYVLSNTLGYSFNAEYVLLMVLNASFLSLITKGGFDIALKGITIQKVEK